MGKSRVAPLKQITIPRMELAAAVVAVNIDKMLKEELEVKLLESTFWTDSTTVLRYIENEKLRFKTFVANRIAIIRESTKPQQWRYVNTSKNPADCASRGLTCERFMKNISWIHGPSFLKEPENMWPEKILVKSIQADDEEVKQSASVNLVCTSEGMDTVIRLINHYSDWYRLKRAVAWILCLKDMLIQKCKTKNTTTIQAALTMQDLTRAENEIIKVTQGQIFKDEISMLQKEEVKCQS
ncbi:uncharacterized protein LOC130550835 [Triplophysa rosa]|uniref:uncharacterized protein LOC130550835 n=1 Tax=Triplophysa rosa TaxID=992332 RepID=UPI002545FBFF|nr:uncharacterized protein LOC130550835 [Triplophysa rosa]